MKESLYFHAQALEAIQDKLVAMLRERKEIGPGDIKDLLGISRKYAIPLLEFFDRPPGHRPGRGAAGSCAGRKAGSKVRASEKRSHPCLAWAIRNC